MNFHQFILQDLPANRIGSLASVRYLSVLLYRISQVVYNKSKILGSIVKQLNHLITGADISPDTNIGPGLILHHPTGVVIGPGVTAGPGLELNQGVTLGFGRDQGSEWEVSPKLGARIMLGAGCRIIGKVRLADDIKVGANAVVVKSCDTQGATLVGVPAKPINGERK